MPVATQLAHQYSLANGNFHAIQFEHALSLLTKAYELLLSDWTSIENDHPAPSAQRIITEPDYDHTSALELQKHSLMHPGTDCAFGVAELRPVDNNHCLMRRA
ncbi:MULTISPECIES: hypothetical protein [unclassified Pseudomonas]|uniref:hypothetical protein n=1 Tax=unclassified Pseudomonas TaxID=196821 RepID=UPI0011EC7BC3|nr:MULTISPECIES: hypothetical protein [unclassified Pseudomonas]KAA0943474.1 hypothetical protein FQ182_24905 [Pseudomonas sp. ANT_H4]KAA0947230.1 hypothetical protein FQ186_25575 [Pseudomonas sp. ANT_H14]